MGNYQARITRITLLLYRKRNSKNREISVIRA